MKIVFILALQFSFILSSCSDSENNPELVNGWNYDSSNVSCIPTTSTHEIPDEFDFKISLYLSDNFFKDSVLTATSWYKNDTLIFNEGSTISTNPIEFYLDSEIIQKANRQNKLETFDENICETGGTSAWNKYLIEYDNQYRPLNVEHYKAWWYEGLTDEFGNAPEVMPDKPSYFLHAIISYSYGTESIIETTTFPEYDETVIKMRITDNHSRPTFESYQTNEFYQKFYFDYTDR